MNITWPNETFNTSEHGVRDPILGGTLLAINICIVILNSLALMVIMRFRTKNCIDILVLGLALTDLIKGLIPVPMSVYTYLSSWYMRNETTACDFFGWIAFTTNSASMLILSIMAMERFMAIVKPFAYRSMITKKRMELSVLVAVFFSAVLSLLPVIGVGRMISYNRGAYCHFDYSSSKTLATKVYSIFILIYGFSLTIAVMIAYSVIFYKIRDLIKRHRRFSVAKIVSRSSTKSDRRQRDINLKVEKMFSYLTVGLMFLYWFSWFPFLAVVFASQTGIQAPHDKVDLFAIRVAVVNAMLNPLACASFCKPYRRGFLYYYKKLLSYVGFARPDSDVFDPWRQRSYQAARDPTPGNSFGTQIDSRFPTSRPTTEFNDPHTDSAFQSDSLPRNVSSMHETKNRDIHDDCRLSRATLRLQPLTENLHETAQDENGEHSTRGSAVEAKVFSLNEEIAGVSDHEDLKLCYASETRNLLRSQDAEKLRKRKTIHDANISEYEFMTEQNRSKWKRHSVPAFYNCIKSERKERPKSLELSMKRNRPNWSLSLGLQKDLRSALYSYNRDLSREIHLVGYSMKNEKKLIGESITDRDPLPRVYEKPCEPTPTEVRCLRKKTEDRDTFESPRRCIARAYTFNGSNNKEKDSIAASNALQRKFCQDSRDKQRIYSQRRSKSNPTEYRQDNAQGRKYLSLQEDLSDSLKRINTVTKQLLYISGSLDKDEDLHLI